MLFTAHALTGAAIGVATGNPFWGFILGIFSHFLLDGIPHLDQGSFYIDRRFRGPSWTGVDYIEKGKKFRVRRDWAMLISDMSIACVFSLLFLAGKPFFWWIIYIAGATGGLLPDILDTSPFWKEKFRATRIGKIVHSVHMFFHWPLSSRYWYIGIATQITIVLIDIYTILKTLN